MKTSSALLLVMLASFVLTTACGRGNGDWYARFVIYEGNMYVVTEDSHEIKEAELEAELGSVMKYAESEQNFRKNEISSNKFEEGSVLFKISNTDVMDSIAVRDREGDLYRLAYQGEYQ